MENRSIWEKFQDKIRDAILWLNVYVLRRKEWISQLSRRVHLTEIGVFGHVTDMDRSMASDEQLKPLNRFERWLAQSFIESEKPRRQEAFRQACIEVTGEDPYDDY